MSKANDLKADLERDSFHSTLNSEDTPDDRLRILGEKNPHYVHELTWTPEEEKQIVRTFDLKVPFG